MRKNNQPDWTFEKEAFKHGWKTVAGIDEAGRGPLAGPVVAAACILPLDFPTTGINDSKKLTENQRTFLYQQLTTNTSVTWSVGIVSNDEIDKINIYQATIKAMLEAVTKLSLTPDALLVDGMALQHPTLPAQKIIKGDSRSFSIASASIIAKVTRDKIMQELDTLYPGYDFKKHRGYPTRAHREAIKELGVTPVHRKTFRLLKN